MNYSLSDVNNYFYLQVIFKRFFSGKSEGDCCTLYSDRTLINRQNVKAEPQSAYRADMDFLVLAIQARVIAAAMSELGLTEKSSQPIKLPLPKNLLEQSKLSKLQYLHKAASLLVDKFVFDDHSVNGLLDQILTAQQTQDTSDIVANLAKLVNINLDKEDISISHRLKAQQSSSRDTRFPSRPPSIIVKFVRREVRDRLYRARNRLKNFSTKDLNLGRLSDNKIFISESLTQRNRELFNSALKLKKDLGYRFIWSFYGRIFIRRDADSPAVPISSDKDLENIKRRHSSTSSSR